MKFGTVPQSLEYGRTFSRGGPELFWDGERSLSHDQLGALLARVAADLNALEVGRRTRLITIPSLPDGPLTACVLLALLCTADCAPVNPDLRGAEVAALIPELADKVLACMASARRRPGTLRLRSGCQSLKWTGTARAACVDRASLWPGLRNWQRWRIRMIPHWSS